MRVIFLLSLLLFSNGLLAECPESTDDQICDLLQTLEGQQEINVLHRCSDEVNAQGFPVECSCAFGRYSAEMGMCVLGLFEVVPPVPDSCSSRLNYLGNSMQCRCEEEDLNYNGTTGLCVRDDNGEWLFQGSVQANGQVMFRRNYAIQMMVALGPRLDLLYKIERTHVAVGVTMDARIALVHTSATDDTLLDRSVFSEDGDINPNVNISTFIGPTFQVLRLAQDRPVFHMAIGARAEWDATYPGNIGYGISLYPELQLLGTTDGNLTLGAGAASDFQNVFAGSIFIELRVD